jgi:hypothetical protein
MVTLGKRPVMSLTRAAAPRWLRQRTRDGGWWVGRGGTETMIAEYNGELCCYIHESHNCVQELCEKSRVKKYEVSPGLYPKDGIITASAAPCHAVAFQ